MKVIKELIISGQFEEGYNKIKNITFRELESILFEIACDEENICAYSFMEFVLNKNESAEYHCLTARLLNLAFYHLGGAYQTALYHIRSADKLQPDDIEITQALLFYHDIPEKLITDIEAEEIERRIATLKSRQGAD